MIVRLLTKVDVLHIHIYFFSRTIYLSIMYLPLCIVVQSWNNPLTPMHECIYTIFFINLRKRSER
jgi:hypothetical protein